MEHLFLTDLFLSFSCCILLLPNPLFLLFLLVCILFWRCWLAIKSNACIFPASLTAPACNSFENRNKYEHENVRRGREWGLSVTLLQWGEISKSFTSRLIAGYRFYTDWIIAGIIKQCCRLKTCFCLKTGVKRGLLGMSNLLFLYNDSTELLCQMQSNLQVLYIHKQPYTVSHLTDLLTWMKGKAHEWMRSMFLSGGGQP